MKITLLVGTMTGTAQLVRAGTRTGAGTTARLQVETLLMDKLDASVFARDGVFLVVHLDLRPGRRARQRQGALRRPEGEAARTCRACATACSAWATAPTRKPSISAASASTSCCSELGAQRIGERVQHDASSGVLPEEMAVEWGEGWLALAREAVPAVSSTYRVQFESAWRFPRDYNAAEDLVGGNLKAGRAGKIAYIDDAGQCTFGELAERVNRFGNHLLSLGLRMEDRILIAMHDSIDWPVAFLGAIKAGIVPVAVNTLLTPKDYEYMLSDSRAKALLVSPAAEAAVRAVPCRNCRF